MNLNNISLTISAVSIRQYPEGNMPDIAFAGRSNVGKSSIINRLLNRKNFARVSSSPGKTATINFYNIDGVFHLVDLPGYGFAKVSKKEQQKWGLMIEEYLSKREQLTAVIQLVDLRHKPTADDITMMDWIRGMGYRPIVVATKLDKLKKSEIIDSLRLIHQTLELAEDDILVPFSAKTGEGRDEIWKIIKECCRYEDNNPARD